MHISQPVKTLLYQLRAMLYQVSKEQFRTPVNSLGQATVGQHTRHIIELFLELHKGLAGGKVNYDQRERKNLLQVEPLAAAAEVSQIAERLQGADCKLIITGCYSFTGEQEISVESTYYRELIYNMEHAIHHMAYIKIALSEMGTLQLPAEFGVAPATYRHRQLCAQ